MSDLAPLSTEPGIELLSFQAGGQDYCVDIMSVQEIRSWSRATPLPHAPACLKGVINLRGTVLPVIDLSACLGMAPIPDGERNIIIVISLGGALTGLLVEKVSDILSVPPSALMPPPDLGGDPATHCISALVCTDAALLRVLDLKAVLPGASQDGA